MSTDNRKKKRTYNPRLVSVGLSYSVQEISELYGLHKNAVLRWIKEGLPVIDQKKPYLIHGSELATYLKKKQGGRKHKCQPDEFFCCKCRTPQKAKNGVADISIKNKNKLRISAVCAACGCGVYRAGAVKKLAEYQKIFLTQSIDQPHITERINPLVISDSRKEIKA